MNKQLLQTVRGTNDILPKDQMMWDYIYRSCIETAHLYGYAAITTPTFEYSWIYARGIGEHTEILEKEMYYLRSREADLDIALRPEGTAGVVRAYYQHGLHTEPTPLRLYYYGPMFRHERPQRGRGREFYQFGVESIGDGDASEDALVILLATQILNRLQIPQNQYTVAVNSIGCKSCRPSYIKKLKTYLTQNESKMCDECVRKSKSNPLRVLDCKNPRCQKALAGVPVTLDNICIDCHAHFKLVLEYLEEAGVQFIVNPRIVRGLDYYTQTVFEIIPTLKQFSGQAVIAGGRYNDLVALYGRRSAPAVGFGLGVERLVNLIKDLKISAPSTVTAPVYIIQLGQSAKKKALQIIQQLTSSGIAVRSSLSKDSLKSQLKTASKNNVKFALILGQRELLDKTIILKDMAAGTQETIDINQYLPALLERLK